MLYTYCERLRIVREMRGLTQKEVAEAIGTTQQLYSKYELGEVDMSIDRFKRICQFLKVDPDFILNCFEEYI